MNQKIPDGVIPEKVVIVQLGPKSYIGKIKRINVQLAEQSLCDGDGPTHHGGAENFLPILNRVSSRCAMAVYCGTVWAAELLTSGLGGRV